MASTSVCLGAIPMIKINDEFSIDRDANNWILRQSWVEVAKSGKRKGELIQKERKRYFGTLKQLCHHTVDLGLDHTQGMEELLKSLSDTHSALDSMLRTHSLDMKRLFHGKGLYDG